LTLPLFYLHYHLRRLLAIYLPARPVSHIPRSPPSLVGPPPLLLLPSCRGCLGLGLGLGTYVCERGHARTEPALPLLLRHRARYPQLVQALAAEHGAHEEAAGPQEVVGLDHHTRQVVVPVQPQARDHRVELACQCGDAELSVLRSRADRAVDGRHTRLVCSDVIRLPLPIHPIHGLRENVVSYSNDAPCSSLGMCGTKPSMSGTCRYAEARPVEGWVCHVSGPVRSVSAGAPVARSMAPDDSTYTT
jgi:hypothetical protein